MRSAITLGLGILIAAATPGLRAQVNPSTPNSVKSALGEAGKPAQQAAKPAATKPAPQADKAAGKPTGKHAAKGTAKKPAAKRAVHAVEKPATPGSAPAAAESEVTPVQENSNEDELAGPSAWLCDPCKHGTGEQLCACTDARWQSGGGDLQHCHYPSAATGSGSRARPGTSRRSRRSSAEPGSPSA